MFSLYHCTHHLITYDTLTNHKLQINKNHKIRRKIIEKQFKKIHSLRRSGTSGSETSASVDVLLNNLSLRASLRSDLVAVGNATNCQTDCSIIEEENLADQPTITECKANHSIPDLSVSMVKII